MEEKDKNQAKENTNKNGVISAETEQIQTTSNTNINLSKNQKDLSNEVLYFSINQDSK